MSLKPISPYNRYTTVWPAAQKFWMKHTGYGIHICITNRFLKYINIKFDIRCNPSFVMICHFHFLPPHMNPNINIEPDMFLSVPQVEISDIIRYDISISPWPWSLPWKCFSPLESLWSFYQSHKSRYPTLSNIIYQFHHDLVLWPWLCRDLSIRTQIAGWFTCVKWLKTALLLIDLDLLK
jgi:hypothetical protein